MTQSLNKNEKIFLAAFLVGVVGVFFFYKQFSLISLKGHSQGFQSVNYKRKFKNTTTEYQAFAK